MRGTIEPRVRVAGRLGLLLLLACDSPVSGRSEGMARIFHDDGFGVSFEVEGASTVSWHLTFSTGACCEVESRLERDIDKNVVTIVPRFVYLPCADRCLVLLLDSGTHDFSGYSDVRFRVMGWDDERRLVEAWDTVIPLP